jgi:8-oxo-dGTP diphosphatase
MIEVVAAVIEFKGKLLAFQRGLSRHSYVSNKYEFPGGKVEEGEDQRQALARELQEELDVVAEVAEYLMTVEHHYPDFSIKMHCFLVHINQFNGRLKEHVNYACLSLKDARELDWIEADRPVLTLLEEDFAHVFTG